MYKSKNLLLLILVVGFLFSCGPKSTTDEDGQAMTELISLLFLCKALPKEIGDTGCTFIKLENYGVSEKTGIKLNPEINIQIAILDNKFTATASHAQSENVFSVDSLGKVEPITK